MEKVWYRSYKEGVPEKIDLTNLPSIPLMFEKSCKQFPEKKAVTNLGVSITYAELEVMTRNFASYLKNVFHLKKGTPVGIMLPNTIHYYVSMLGILRAGLIVVNINPLYTPRELEQQLKDAGVGVLVVLENFASTVEKSLNHSPLEKIIVAKFGDFCSFPKRQIVNFVVKYIKKIVPDYHLPEAIAFHEVLAKGKLVEFLPEEVELSDAAFLQYTGGTTGISKGALLTHKNIVSNIFQILAWAGSTFEEGSEVVILPLPLYHIFSLTCGCLLHLHIGSETILITNPRDIKGFIGDIKKYKFTVMYSINTLCNALLQNSAFTQINFSSLKATIVGGMSSTEDVAKSWERVTKKPLTEGYGLTETSPVVTINSFTEYSGGIGYPIPSTDVAIMDENENFLPLNEIGELVVKGPQVMQEYWRRPLETAQAFTSDKWFKTADMAKMDEKGLLRIVDRKKDMIIVSGFNVYPNEVENILMSHPKVLEAAVIGMPNLEKGGERVKAFIVKKDETLTEEEITFYCQSVLTPYKIPHLIIFENELPKSPVGKILRRKLRAEQKNSDELKQAA